MRLHLTPHDRFMLLLLCIFGISIENILSKGSRCIASIKNVKGGGRRGGYCGMFIVVVADADAADMSSRIHAAGMMVASTTSVNEKSTPQKSAGAGSAFENGCCSTSSSCLCCGCCRSCCIVCFRLTHPLIIRNPFHREIPHVIFRLRNIRKFLVVVRQGR